MRIFLSILLFLLSTSVALSEEALTTESKTLTAATAQRVVVDALSECDRLGYQVAVAVVDRSGNLVAFARDPLSGPHTIDISQKKAFTSASTRVSSATLEDMNTLNFSDKLITLRGGLPIAIGGYVYGGVGVSGATSEDDEVCAKAGIDAIREDMEFSQ